jgi:hypothetical protein
VFLASLLFFRAVLVCLLLLGFSLFMGYISIDKYLIGGGEGLGKGCFWCYLLLEPCLRILRPVSQFLQAYELFFTSLVP